MVKKRSENIEFKESYGVFKILKFSFAPPLAPPTGKKKKKQEG